MRGENVAQFKLRIMNWQRSAYSVLIWQTSAFITNSYLRAQAKSDRNGVGLLATSIMMTNFTTVTIPDRALERPASAGSPQPGAQTAFLAAGGAVSFQGSANVPVQSCPLPCCFDVQLKPPSTQANNRSLWITRVDFNCSPLHPQRHYRNGAGELCLFWP